jgi:DNA-binding response OmpR family regulator
MSNYRILVVDDDPLVCKGLKFNLEQAGYRVSTASTSYAAHDLADHNPFDAAILDIGLPDDSGLDLCRALKEQQKLPVIFLTARRRELDEIIGLEIGGDDYIVKPFSADLLLAHLRSVLRRIVPQVRPLSPANHSLHCGPFELNPISHTVTNNGTPVDLAPREFDLLKMFMSHPERAFTSNELVESVWGVEFEGETQVLYVQVRSLREKIEPVASRPQHILTLRGIGYKFLP